MKVSGWDFDGGWSLADHARYIIEQDLWEQRKASEAEKKFSARRQGMAVSDGEQYRKHSHIGRANSVATAARKRAAKESAA